MYIKVEVRPGSKQEKISKTGADSFLVFVREKAERNMANKRVLELIREQFFGRRVLVKIVSGHQSQSKIFRVQIIE